MAARGSEHVGSTSLSLKLGFQSRVQNILPPALHLPGVRFVTICFWDIGSFGLRVVRLEDSENVLRDTASFGFSHAFSKVDHTRDGRFWVLYIQSDSARQNEVETLDLWQRISPCRYMGRYRRPNRRS